MHLIPWHVEGDFEGLHDGCMAQYRPSGVRTASGDGTVLVVSRSERLLDAVTEVITAAAMELVQVDALSEAAEAKPAAVVLLGVDAAQNAPPGSAIPPQCLLVGLSDDTSFPWVQAAVLNIHRVAVLPEAAEWLTAYLGSIRDPATTGRVIGVVGGCGGAGASTVSLLVASWAARAGIRTVLIDGDECGGGLDLPVSAEPPPGLHWPDLAGATGTISAAQLASALPVTAGFALLSWGQGRPSVSSPVASTRVGIEIVLAARRAYDLCLVDIGRSGVAGRTSPGQGGLAALCDELALVVPARVRPIIAASQVLARLPAIPTSAVVQGPMGEGLDAESVARSLGLELAGYLPRLRGAVAATEDGRLQSLARSRAVRRLARSMLDRHPRRAP